MAFPENAKGPGKPGPFLRLDPLAAVAHQPQQEQEHVEEVEI